MLHLKLATDPRWVNIAEQNVSEILTDHAYCEQKAASTAISLIVQYPEYPELVTKMAELAREEMDHFIQVHHFIQQRGFELGRERKDEYVNDLVKFVRKGEGRATALLDKLLFAAMVEARSCERFKLLSENVKDTELATFYRNLMESEAGHYTLFITLARELCGRETADTRWAEMIAYEASILLKYSKKETIHG